MAGIALSGFTLAVLLVLTRPDVAWAFPLPDATAGDRPIPAASGPFDTVPDRAGPPRAASPDDTDDQAAFDGVRAMPRDGGWRAVPWIDLRQALTDNVFQRSSPRNASSETFVSPGISVNGDRPRLKLTFDLSPTLGIFVPHASLNSLTERMDGLASMTVVPDFVYLDARAISGVHDIFGGFGGLGALGQPVDLGSVLPGDVSGLAGGDSFGITKDDEVQTSDIGVSPYLLRRFGGFGNVKLGYSLGIAESDTLSGFAVAPFPTGGIDSQTLVSNEETAHYDSGDLFGRAQNGFDVDLSQSRTHTGAGFAEATTAGIAATPDVSSNRATESDRITYRVDRRLAVFASGGHETISYTNVGFKTIDDLTWSLGTILTPNPDSRILVGYGHADGFNSLSVDGHYGLTARTTVSASYGSTLGTQLQALQGGLNLAAGGRSGGLINGRTGGPLFGDINAVPVQGGVFRTTTLVLGGRTSLARDTISLNAVITHQDSLGGAAGFKARSKTATISWVHRMRPTMSVGAGLSFSWQDNGAGDPFAAGHTTSEIATVAWQYQMSDTLTSMIRYSFLGRQSAAGALDATQNLVVVGVSKYF